MSGQYPPFSEVKEQLEERQQQTGRVCSFKGFGLKDTFICNCDQEELKECRENYDQIKKGAGNG